MIVGTLRLMKYSAWPNTACKMDKPPNAPTKDQNHTTYFEVGFGGVARYPNQCETAGGRRERRLGGGPLMVSQDEGERDQAGQTAYGRMKANIKQLDRPHGLRDPRESSALRGFMGEEEWNGVCARDLTASSRVSLWRSVRIPRRSFYPIRSYDWFVLALRPML